MKRLQTLSTFLVVFGLAGVPSLRSDEPVKIQGHAIVRTLKGKATYTTAGGRAKRLKANAELAPGTTIATGPNSIAFVSVNGVFSALRLAENTTLVLDRMERTGTTHEASSDTLLDLKSGSIIGQVKKIVGQSRYEIKTPHGVAGIRGTDFAVDVGPSSDGKMAATFTCLTGQLVVAAMVDGTAHSKVIHGGECWTPGAGDPRPVPPERVEGYMKLFWDNPPLSPSPPIAPPVITVLPVFPNGAPPLGGSSRP